MLEIIALMKPVQLNDNSVIDAIDTPAIIWRKQKENNQHFRNTIYDSR